MHMQRFFPSQQRSFNIAGFTLVELLVTISIFVFMTALVLAKYDTFDKNTLLTNAAYDIALQLREAQVYGISVLGAGGDFSPGYSVVLGAGTSPEISPDFASNNKLSLLINNSSSFLGSRPAIEGMTRIKSLILKKGIYISDIHFLTEQLTSWNQTTPRCQRGVALVTFVRPNPDARLSCKFSSGNVSFRSATNLRITLSSSDRKFSKYIFINREGQIKVSNNATN